MTRHYKIVKGAETEVRSYIERARELRRYAEEAYRNQDCDACAILTIHASISLADAACIVHKGARYSGSSHDEAVQFFHDLGIQDDGFKKAARRLGQMIGEKTAAEYGGKNLTSKEIESIYKNGERFREYLFTTILRDYYLP